MTGSVACLRMNWLDWVLVALLALAALHGWQRGAAVQVLALGGFWLGLLLGALIAPTFARLASGVARSLVAILVVIVAAALLGGIGELLGIRFGQLLRKFRLGPLDKGLGVFAAVAGTVLAAWLVSSIVAGSRFTSLAHAVQGSHILRAVDRALPTVPSVFAHIESFLAQQGFPVVFVNLPPGLLAPAAPPGNAAVRAALAAAGPSTVKVVGPACSAILEGSGFVVAPHLVVTNAHVVAGDPAPQVVDAAGTHAATPVFYDPRLDIAVLEVPGLSDPVLHLDGATVARGTKGAALGYPEGGGLTSVAAAVNGAFAATGLDIYGNAVVTRQVYELNSTIRPGNSGGPLVSTGQGQGTAGIPAGTVMGVVFARSSTNPNVGYALTMGAVEKDIHRAEASMRHVGTGSCAG